MGATRIIPARVIHHWDFRPYKVSNFSAELLDYNYTQPLYDILVINESALTRIKPLMQAGTLRRQLKSLYAYLRSCRGGKDILQLMEQRVHLVTEETLYSMQDVRE